MKLPLTLFLLAFALAACGDSPVAPEVAPHHEIIYTRYSIGSPATIIRALSDGSNQRVVVEGTLLAAPVRGRILYLSPDEHNIYAGSIDGSVADRIDSVIIFSTRFNSMEIAPDGERFLSVDWDILRSDGLTHLYIQRMDGSDKRLLTTTILSASKAAFSPDGGKIAFLGSDRKLYTINVDGTGQVALTAAPASTTIRERETMGWAPQWSPDGKWIAMESFDTPMIDIVRADGGSPASMPSFRGGFPVWSPDGTEIACGDNEWIIVHPINGTSRGVISDREIDIGYRTVPRWSPDGRRILGDHTGITDLFSVDIASSRPTFIDTRVGTAHWIPE